MNTFYEELKKKNEEKLEGHDDLADLKRATFNHFLTIEVGERERTQRRG